MSNQAKRRDPGVTARGQASKTVPPTRVAPERSFRLAPTTSLPKLLDSNGGDTRFRQLLYDIAIFASYLEAARSYLATRMGVSSPQYNMMMIVAQHAGHAGISISEVAAHLHVTNTFVTAEIKKLMRENLVGKEANPADARSVLLRLTPEGEERVRALEQDLLFVNDQLFRGLSRADFEHLSRIVGSLIDDFSSTIALLGALGSGAGPQGGRDAALAVREFQRRK